MPKPIVILAGWLGSRTSNLSKYASIYERAGSIVLQFRFAPDSGTFFKCVYHRKTQSEIVREIAHEVGKISSGFSPILFHGFSSGGAVPFSVLLRALYGNHSHRPSELTLHEAENHGLNQLRKHLAGVILDSGPIPLKANFGKYRRERLELFKTHHPALSAPLNRLRFSLDYSRVVLDFHLGQLRAAVNFGRDASSFSFFQLLREQTMTISRGIPELYLLSTEDSHVRAMDPKSNYVARRRDIASNQIFPGGSSLVDAHHYATGEHVSLLVAHPDDYRRRCLAFLERCVHLHAARHRQPQPDALPLHSASALTGDAERHAIAHAHANANARTLTV